MSKCPCGGFAIVDYLNYNCVTHPVVLIGFPPPSCLNHHTACPSQPRPKSLLSHQRRTHLPHQPTMVCRIHFSYDCDARRYSRSQRTIQIRECKVLWQFRSQCLPEGEGAMVKNQKATEKECGQKALHQAAQDTRLPQLLYLWKEMQKATLAPAESSIVPQHHPRAVV